MCVRACVHVGVNVCVCEEGTENFGNETTQNVRGHYRVRLKLYLTHRGSDAPPV